MSAGKELPTRGQAARLIDELRKKGVQLWTEDLRLRYRAPHGTLSQDDLAAIRADKEAILALLETGGVRPAPLTYAQRLHWQSLQLAHFPGLRTITSATRIQGTLDVERLRSTIEELGKRHEVLRTRIQVIGEEPFQEVVGTRSMELTMHDLTSIEPGDAREQELMHRIDAHVLTPIDVTAEPLATFDLFKVRPDEHVLLVAMEHVISDASSMGILLRDLFAIFAGLIEGKPPQLPPAPMRIADYGAWLRARQGAWLDAHGSYWREHLADSPRVRFPTGEGKPAAAHYGWAVAAVSIGPQLKADLREWCHQQRTTLPMAVFTAYAALVLRWCNVRDVVIQYQTSGRDRPEIENSLGYFASILPLRVQIGEHDTFLDLLRQVTAEYCRASEHADSSYLSAQLPRPGFGHNTAFNWVPQSMAPASAGEQVGLRLTRIPVAFPMRTDVEWDNEPVLLLYDTDEGITGRMRYPMNRFSRLTMERCTYSFLTFVVELLKRSETCVRDVPLAWRELPQ